MTVSPYMLRDLEQIGAFNPEKAADLFTAWKEAPPNTKVQLEQHIAVLGDIAEWSSEDADERDRS